MLKKGDRVKTIYLGTKGTIVWIKPLSEFSRRMVAGVKIDELEDIHNLRYYVEELILEEN